MWVTELGIPISDEEKMCSVKNILVLLAGVCKIRLSELVIDENDKESYQKKEGCLLFKNEQAKF
jgi:hypothetical protein